MLERAEKKAAALALAFAIKNILSMILVCTCLVSLGAGAALMGAAKFLRPAEVRQCAGRTAEGRVVAIYHHDDRGFIPKRLFLKDETTCC